MLNTKLSERLEACLQIEILCEEIYYSLCDLYPEAEKLFQEIAENEKRHADILTICTGFNKVGDLPNAIVPSSLPLIKKSLDIVEHIKAEINEKKLSLKKALMSALELEKLTAENYFNEIMKKESDSDVISYLQQFYSDEKSHAEMINNFMKGIGESQKFNRDA